MHRSLSIARTVVLAAGVVQLVLGALFWAHVGKNLVPLHETIGSVLVIALWVVAILSARLGAPLGLVVLTIVWGLVVPFVGLAQEGWLRGSTHWIIQAIHLLLGLGTMGLASIVAARTRPRAATPAWDAHDTANR